MRDPREMRPAWSGWILAAAFVVHAAMWVSLATGFLNPLFHDAANRPGPGADFFAIYQSGRQVTAGQSPYDYEPARRPPDMPMYAPFRYTPGVALTLGIAASRLPPWPAYVVWLLVLELVLWVDVYCLGRLIPNRTHRNLCRAGWLAFSPLYLELWMGQFTFLSASLLFWAYFAWRSSRRWWGAVAWSASMTLKLFALALVPLLLRRRRMTTLAVGAVVLVASCAWFLFEPGSWRGFFDRNFLFQGLDFGEFHAGNFGLQSFLFQATTALATPTLAAWKLLSPCLAVGIAIVAAWAMMTSRSDDRVALAMVLLMLPLSFKHVWEHHYVVALPASALLVAAWAERRTFLIAVAACFIVLALPSPFVFLQGSSQVPPAWVRMLYHGPKPVAALVLFAMCAWDLLRQAGQESTGEA